MAGLNEIAKWEREVYQIEEDDPVLGGVKGVTNKPLKHLANRTLYLKQVLEAAGQKLMPKKLTATTRNTADSTGHTHEIDLASTTTKGLVQLTNDTGLDSESLALTAKAGKAIAQSVAQLQLSTTNALNQKVNKTDISNAVNSTSQTTVASSQAVKTAYDLANSKYTAQDASPTQKGLVQLANNLTTNDATKALTAAQGKILKDEIDRIEIGGRNLIKNSRLLNDTTHWNVIGGRDVRNGIAVLKSLDTSSQWCWRQTFDLPEKQYTFSAEVKPERTAFYLHLQNGKSWVNFHARNLTPGIWQKISITFVSAIRNISFINPGEGLIELQNPMLVEGNRAMTWAPAPEDLTEEALNSARQNYVAKAGDTMTGNLMINHAVSHVKGQRNSVDTWYVGNESGSNQDVILNSYVHHTYIKLKQDRVESNKPIYRGNHLVFDEGNLLPVRQIDLRSIANGQISFQDATPAQLPLGAFVGLSKKSHLNGAGDGWMMINKGWPDNSGVFACNRIGISGDRIRFQTANNLNAWGNTIELANLSDFIYQKIGNFEIRKYPDGMMIQTYFYDVNDLKEWEEKQFTWAVAFADKPMVIPKVEHTYGINSDVGSAIMRKSTNAVCYYKLYEHNSENQGDCRVQFLGIGRWK
ncbi:phage tail protein [Glaesserella parasuis]|uniref:tail fiber protein n=1 Tax=Glaesserella parasuis TaxID=738 RepID=UPI00135E8ABF|nr:tail fiber protein [Glaesserella parasuis]MDP0043484.1 tail fiber protein [Glaesserella parasuis]MDP0134983.1 tail fiber protein [Glaesserella parasuis]MDP0143433.1 tail fiber protein [Glaesserella parasuis]MDP0238562.1 tail fiber protein [Glaesserella parasuis]MDP0257638.1 tail fiber protein [Glaesserella parasuis]